MHRAKKPFVAAFGMALLGLLLSVIAIATPEWTVSRGVKIGLWTLTDENGVSYSWTDRAYSESFFYETWFMAVRGIMMAGIIFGALGIIFNIFLILKGQFTTSYGNILLSYYSLTFACLLCSVCLYSTMICQPVNSAGEITNKIYAVEYIYTAGYGYSVWLLWIGAGIFLPAAGLAYEGGHQDTLAKREIISDDFKAAAF
uniref:Uncharacterized protein n=1 Tax=Ciona savignyi TaxID=51511 RepID=H2Z4U9_CIOSA